MTHPRAAVCAVVAILSLCLTACGRAPDLPADDLAMYQTLTGTDSQEFLNQISTHVWDDGGRAAAERLSRIAADADSADDTTAQHAGQAAQAIATFLSEDKGKLLELSAGWFGMKRRSVGALNPELVRAFASALVPYQGALVGDMDDAPGFTMIGDPVGLSAARNVFAVIDTDTRAGVQFNDAAYQRVHDYLKAYGQAVAGTKPDELVTLRSAAGLAGVIAGGQRESGNSSIRAQTAQYWINWAGYEVAKTMDARPGAPDIADMFYMPGGVLKSPDQVSANDLDAFSTALQNFTFHHGLHTIGTDFQASFDAAAGK